MSTSGTATTIPIYGADQNTLTEGSNIGLRFINITTSGVISMNNTQTYTIKNPLAFLYNTTAPKDWYTDTEVYQNDALWNQIEVHKSNYDPCPYGWRVPHDGTWNDISLTSAPYYIAGNMASTGDKYATNGRLYNEQVWIPAGGYRSASSGSLARIGFYGYDWTTCTSAINSLYLLFGMTEVSINNPGSRAHCLPVRCIQE